MNTKFTERPSGRAADALRAVTLEPDVAKHAEGSCLTSFGDTKVMITATVEERVPGWLRDSGHGWVTAEYGMLPRATNTRTNREAKSGQQSGRSQEIQRLIGRSLRAVTDLKAMGEMSVRLDCDVLQADGEPQQAIGNAECGPFSWLKALMGGGCRVGNQAFRITEIVGNIDQL